MNWKYLGIFCSLLGIILGLYFSLACSPTSPSGSPTPNNVGDFVGTWQVDNLKLSIGQSGLRAVVIINIIIDGNPYVSVMEGNVNPSTESMSGSSFSVPPEDNDGKLEMECSNLRIQMREDRLSLIFIYDCNSPMNSGDLVLQKTANHS